MALDLTKTSLQIWNPSDVDHSEDLVGQREQTKNNKDFLS